MIKEKKCPASDKKEDSCHLLTFLLSNCFLNIKKLVFLCAGACSWLKQQQAGIKVFGPVHQKASLPVPGRIFRPVRSLEEIRQLFLEFSNLSLKKLDPLLFIGQKRFVTLQLISSIGQSPDAEISASWQGQSVLSEEKFL